MGEFETEPVPGLPANLPEGETMLWQGAPDWRRLAVEAFHVRKVAAWFAALGALRLLEFTGDGTSREALIVSLASLLVVGVLALGILSLLAWLVARTTVYTITSKRVVMRFGVALPMAINLPFRRIETAALRKSGARDGDIALTLAGNSRPAYLSLWPHARAWEVARPQPALRCLADATSVAGILAGAMSAELPGTTGQAREPQDHHAPGHNRLTAGAA